MVNIAYITGICINGVSIVGSLKIRTEIASGCHRFSSLLKGLRQNNRNILALYFFFGVKD